MQKINGNSDAGVMFRIHVLTEHFLTVYRYLMELSNSMLFICLKFLYFSNLELMLKKYKIEIFGILRLQVKLDGECIV